MDSSILGSTISFIITLVILAGFAAIIALTFSYLVIRNKDTASSAIRVKKGDQDLDGVPFFLKQSRWLHETTYLQTLITCSLSAMEIKLDDEGERASTNIFYANSKTTPWSEEAATALQKIQLAMAQTRILTDPDDQLELWTGEILASFESLAVYEGNLPVGDTELPRIGNTVKEEIFVDYGTQHTINYPQPLVGSANVSVELTADGTLGKATAEIKDDTLSTLLGALPIQDVVSSTLAPAPAKGEVEEAAMAVADEEPSVATKYRFSMACKQHYVRHVFFNLVDSNNYQEPIEPGAGAWYRREFVADLQPEATSEIDSGKNDSDKTRES